MQLVAHGDVVLSSFASLQKLALCNLSVSYDGLVSIVETCTNLTVRTSQ